MYRLNNNIGIEFKRLRFMGVIRETTSLVQKQLNFLNSSILTENTTECAF